MFSAPPATGEPREAQRREPRRGRSTRHRRARPGPVTAEARLDGDPSAVRAAYAAGGAADFEIDVTLRVGDEETGGMRFTWSARAPRG